MYLVVLARTDFDWSVSVSMFQNSERYRIKLKCCPFLVCFILNRPFCNPAAYGNFYL